MTRHGEELDAARGGEGGASWGGRERTEKLTELIDALQTGASEH